MAQSWRKCGLVLAFLLVILRSTSAQCTSNASCSNYGICLTSGTGTSSTCTCPVGYGGQNCSTTLCSNPLEDNSLRLPQVGNTTCGCDTGFGGYNCNVCQSDTACRSRQSTASTAASSLAGVDESLVCNTTPYTHTTTYGDCSVVNSLLQSVFPGSTVLSFTKIVQPQTSNDTGISQNALQAQSPNSTYAFISHLGVEQFYCHATSCSQTLSTQSALGASNGNSTDWTCTDLSCNCIAGTAFCGGTSGLDLTSVLNQLSGPLSINCDNTANGNCTFNQATLRGLFGSNGLVLSDCQFGECVAEQILASSSTPVTAPVASNSLSGGVIAGLVVVAAFVIFLVLLILCGLVTQRKARHPSKLPNESSNIRLGLIWTNVSYRLRRPFLAPFLGRKHSTGPEMDGSDTSQRSDPELILNDLSGDSSPGSVTAILGPSGAGKTTLVELLAGRHKGGSISGELGYYNESEEKIASSHMLAFVDQEDHLPSFQTVREALLFASYLSLPEPISKQKKEFVVDELIDSLGLRAVANNTIGHASRRGISGGEKRRLSIGLALVSNPQILVLDEPSSGLDSVSATRVMQILSRLAHERGTTVLLTVHQPSSAVFHSFDNVILLAHGQMLYNGPSSAASTWLDRMGKPVPAGFNVADQLLEAAFFEDTTGAKKNSAEVSAASSGESGLEEAKTSRAVQRLPSPRATACFFTQLQILGRREVQSLTRDWYNLAYILIGAIIGVFVGGLFFHVQITIGGLQNRVGVFFFLTALIGFGSISSLVRFSHAKPLFRRERSGALYHAWSWLATYVVLDVLFIRVIPNLLMSLIIYWMAGLADDAAAFFKFWLIVFLLTIVVCFFNMILAAIFPEENSSVAIVISSIVILFNVGFSGYGLNLHSITGVLSWIQYLAPLKYALEAMTVNDVALSNLTIQDTLEGVPIDISAIPILETLFGFNLDNYYRDVLVLMAFVIGLGIILAFAVLKYVKESK